MLLSGSGDGDTDFYYSMLVMENELNKNGLYSTKEYVGKGYENNSPIIRQTLKNNLNNNLWMFIYRGHGLTNELCEPLSLKSDEISDFPYNSIPPITFSFACWTNNMTDTTCFGDMWLCTGKDVGGVVHFGASVPSGHLENNVLSKNVMKRFDSEHNYTIGSLIDKGKAAYYATVMNDQDLFTKERHVKMYNLFGDPSIRVRGNKSAKSYLKGQSKAPVKNEDMSDYNNKHIIDVNGNALSINNIEEIKSLYIYDISGRLVVADNYLPSSYSSNISLENGVYIVVIKNIFGDIKTSKIIINH